MRREVCLIRKSTEAQGEQAQIDNVKAMLKERGVTIPADAWFVCTVSRAKVRGNVEFRRLLDEVEADRISTVYIESQDRFGTGGVAELFTLLGLLAEHRTRLYDLREKSDLTLQDDATEMRAFLGGLKSKKERKDLAFRSLRTRIANFNERGSWPNGTHPFGFGKRCLSPTGQVLWEWQPTSRVLGQAFFPDAVGQLKPSEANRRLPKKDRADRNILILSSNRTHVETVQLVFDLYTRVGLSRRQISARLNDEGRKFYDLSFTHPLVSQILVNPAYVGDTHFGKTQSGELHTFDRNGLIVEVPRDKCSSVRAEADRLIKQDTHEGLVDRRTWELAQARLQRDSERISHPSRNPAYYLKPLLVCGHCGKNVTGRTETHSQTKVRTVVYFCSSYITGRCNGTKGTCGAHRITQADAEQLLLEKISERDLRFDPAASEVARKQVERQLRNLEYENDEARRECWDWVEEGTAAFVKYLRDTMALPETSLRMLKREANAFYQWGGRVECEPWDGPLKWKQFRAAIAAAEEAVVAQATAEIEKLKARLKRCTLALLGDDEFQLEIIKEETDRIKSEIQKWQPRTQPLSARLRAMHDADSGRAAARDKLVAEWPALDFRERSEALRALFHTVTLYWMATFHPSEKKPGRPRRTARDGRYSYALDHERIQWSFNGPKAEGDV